MNKKTITIFLAGVAVVVMLVVSALLLGVFFGAQPIPPVHILYDATRVAWLAQARGGLHLLTSFCMLILGSIMFATAQTRKTASLRLRGYMMSIFWWLTAVWHITVLGLIIWGGAWHWASFAAGVLDAVVALVCVYVMFTTHKEEVSQ